MVATPSHAPIIIDTESVAKRVATADKEVAMVATPNHHPPTEQEGKEEWLRFAFDLAKYLEPLAIGMMLRTRRMGVTGRPRRMVMQWARLDPDKTRICGNCGCIGHRGGTCVGPCFACGGTHTNFECDDFVRHVIANAMRNEDLINS